MYVDKGTILTGTQVVLLKVQATPHVELKDMFGDALTVNPSLHVIITA